MEGNRNGGTRRTGAVRTGQSKSLSESRYGGLQTRKLNTGRKRAGALTKTESRQLAERKRDIKWEEGVQRVRHGVDRPMLVIILLLLCLGTVMVFSASYPNAISSKGDATYYIRRQLVWLVAGGIFMTMLAVVPYPVYKKATPPIAIVSLLLLALVFVMGTAQGVAKRWIIVGGVSIQPSEIAKLSVVLMLAWYTDRYADKMAKCYNQKERLFHTIVVPGAIMFLFCGMVLLEKHLSGTVIIALISLAVIFLGGAKLSQMAICYGVPIAAAGAVYLMTNEYALKRIITHGDENADKLKEAWQTTQGLYAIGSGGLLGTGLGESNLKHNYVSEAQNDFIFTIWCEEMGLVGALILIALYGVFVWRGMVIAKHAPDTFSSLVAFGITCQVGIQAVLNMLVVTDLIPNTGIALPFFSYGGSSLILLMCEMGILLSISKHSFQKNK